MRRDLLFLYTHFLSIRDVVHSNRQAPGGCAVVCMALGPDWAHPKPCLEPEEIWSFKATLFFVFFVFRMHLPQKPCSCLSLWKSCGLKEKVHTCVVCVCVCLHICASRYLCLDVFIFHDCYLHQKRVFYHFLAGSLIPFACFAAVC